MHEQHGLGGGFEKMLRAAAEQQLVRPRVPVGAHDEKIGAAIARCGGGLVARTAHPHSLDFRGA